MQHLRTIEWIQNSPDSLVPGKVRLIDQTRLPTEQIYLETDNLDTIWTAIKTLQVRGAPAIGIAAAMGIAAHAQNTGQASTPDDIIKAVESAAKHLATSRPTAVNLFWAINRMRNKAVSLKNSEPDDIKVELVKEAMAIRDEDAAMCRAIGNYGAGLLKHGMTVLTHCNAGSLATSELGTALAPIYVAEENGRKIKVFSDETRPLLQGSRLTAWELNRAGIDVTVICDNTAAQVMKEGKIDIVFTGADRIAANGDSANKIGTYGLALLAKAHAIPFYILAPSSTMDFSLSSGINIPIEEREPEEVTIGFGKRTAPDKIKVYSPAFDVTPAWLITGIICENGIAYPDYNESLKKLAGIDNTE